MASFCLWSLREDVLVEEEPVDETVVLHSRFGNTTLRRPRPALVRALRRMSLGPTALSNVLSAEEDWREVKAILDHLSHLVVRSFGFDPEKPLLSVVPLSPQARFRTLGSRPVNPVRLSRFAMIRSAGSDFVMESPLSLYRVALHGGEAMAALSRVVDPAARGFSDDVFHTLIDPLMAAQMVAEAGSDPLHPGPRGDDDPALACWDPVELLFHTRATLGRHDYDFGVTYPMGEPEAVPPLVKPPGPGATVELRHPPSGTPLAAVIEVSSDLRHLGPDPVTEDELGALLHRTARIRAVMGGIDRPYSSAGGNFALEIYAVVHNCQGVPRGIYHYDPSGHRMERLNTAAAGLEELLQASRVAGNLTALPAVVFFVTARFQRVLHKYSGLGYSLVLRDFGALSQLLTLVCGDLGLAGHRIDGVDIEATSRILGIDWRAESGVGSFSVGRPAGREPGVSRTR